jgi:serine/alanine adding enzyme
MGGLENTLSASDGLLKFKKHFNPRIEEYVGEFDLPVNHFLFNLSEIAYKLRKKIR